MYFHHLALWIIVLLLPHLTRGLLSDYKICADSQCESLLSRVQALRDHPARDCRFLAFKRGDVIFVYHKLTGRRQDLWAGSIDKQFGYFQKDAVKEEQVYATTETVVETRDYDFFCMDENGYVKDSSDLDIHDDLEEQNLEPFQTGTDTTGAQDEGSGGSEVSRGGSGGSGGSTVSTQGQTSTHTGPHQQERNHQDVSGDQRDAHVPTEQASSSSSSSWLGSSVTGWLGLTEDGEDGQDGQDGQDREDEALSHAEDKASEDTSGSLASSLSGWLGFGGEQGKPEDSTEGEETDRGETEDEGSILASAVTGWLGFGDEGLAEAAADGPSFRSRRLALDLEANQLKDRGTLDWLGDGLSSALGLGSTGQEADPGEEPGDTKQEAEPQPQSRSWMDVDLRDMLGFGSDTDGADETVGVGPEVGEDLQYIQEPATDSQRDAASQIRPGSTEDRKTEPGDGRKEEEREGDKDGREGEVGESETEIREFVINGGDDGTMDRDATHTEETEEVGELPTELGATEATRVDADEVQDVHDTLNGSKQPVLNIENPSVAGGEREVNPLQTEADTDPPSEDDNVEESRDTDEAEGELQSHVHHSSSTQQPAGGLKGDRAELGEGKLSLTGHQQSADESQSHEVHQRPVETLSGEDEEDRNGERERGQEETTEDERKLLIDQIVNMRHSSVESQLSSDRSETDHSNTETEEFHKDSQQAAAAGSSSSSSHHSEVTAGHGDESGGRTAVLSSSDTAEDRDSRILSKDMVSTPESTGGDTDHTNEAGGGGDGGAEEDTPQEMTVQEMTVQEMTVQEMTVQEMTVQEITVQEMTIQEADADEEKPQRPEMGEEDPVEVLSDHKSQESDGPQTSTVRTESGQNDHENFDTVTLNESSRHTARSADAETQTKPLQLSGSGSESEKSLQSTSSTTDGQQSVSNKEEGTEDEIDAGARYSETATDAGSKDTETQEQEEKEREEKREDKEEEKEGNKDEERRQEGEAEESLDDNNNNDTLVKDLNTKVLEGLKESHRYDSVEDRVSRRTQESDVRDVMDQTSAGRRGGGQETLAEDTKLGGREEERREEGRKENSLERVASDEERKHSLSGGGEKEDFDDTVSDITVSDLSSNQSGVITDQTGAVEHGDNDPLNSNRTESPGISNDLTATQTPSDRREHAEKDEDATTEGGDKKISLQRHDVGLEEDADEQLEINNAKAFSDETERDGRVSASRNDVAAGSQWTDSVSDESVFTVSEDAAPEDPQSGGATEDPQSGGATEDPQGVESTEDPQSGGAFGLFMNTFSYFSRAPSTHNQDPGEPQPKHPGPKERDPKEPQPSEVESKEPDISEPEPRDQEPIDPEHIDPEHIDPEPRDPEPIDPEPREPGFDPERDTASGSSPEEQVHISDPQQLSSPPSSVSSLSQSQTQPSSSSSSSSPLPGVQASSLPPQVPSQPQPRSQASGADARSKATASVSRHYQNLLVHVSLEEAVLLLEVFGRHKLQWLDYNLGETLPGGGEDRQHDLSILSHMEGVLQHHMEGVLHHHMEALQSPQEQGDESRTLLLLALKKLHALLGRMREDLTTGRTDVTDAARKDENNCSGVHCNDRDHSSTEEGESEEGKEWTKEDRTDPQDRPTSPPSQEVNIGVTQRVVTCVQQFLCDLIIHGLAARELLTWLTVQANP